MSHVDLRHGDCLAAMRELPDNSVDAICTDPPYGLSEHKRKDVEQALLAWLTGDRAFVPAGRGGFMSAHWDRFVPPPAVWDECFRVLKPGGHLLAFAGSRTFDLMAISIRLAGLDTDVSPEIRDSIAWLYGSGFGKAGLLGNKPTAHLIDPKFHGFSTGLKPGFEPVICARKPLAKGLTVAQNVQQFGTGALNVDATRIGTGEKLHGSTVRDDIRGGNFASGHRPNPGDIAPYEQHTAGRWPANVCLSSDQAAALDQMSGTRTSSKPTPGAEYGTYQDTGGNAILGRGLSSSVPNVAPYGDSGGASRFFLTAEPDAPDLPIDELAERFMYCAKAPKSERPVVNGIAHNTVKPVKLMRWLVRLVTPPTTFKLVCLACDESMRGMPAGVRAKAQRADGLRSGVPSEGGRSGEAEVQAGPVPDMRSEDIRDDEEVLLDQVQGRGAEAGEPHLSDVQPGVLAGADGQDVLLEAVRGHGARAAGEGVRVVRGDVPTVQEEPVLRSVLCGEELGDGAASGPVQEPSGLRRGVRPSAPNGGEVGLHLAAPASDGRVPGAHAAADRGRASQERDQDGQPTGEPGSDAQGAARPDSEAAAEAVRVSPLPRADSDHDESVHACADCGGPLTLVERPGVVLEPFAGSGTTIEASILEGFDIIAIEREADYLPLIQARIFRAQAKVAVAEESVEPPKKAKGRWPANVALDEESAEALDAQSGIQRDGVATNRNRNPAEGLSDGVFQSGGWKKPTEDQGYGAGGGASRYFFVAKSDKPAPTEPEIWRDGAQQPDLFDDDEGAA